MKEELFELKNNLIQNRADPADFVVEKQSGFGSFSTKSLFSAKASASQDKESPTSFNLDSAVGSTHLTQPIDSPGLSGETLITNKVTAISPDTPDKSMDCAMHALPTAEYRLNPGDYFLRFVNHSLIK